MFGKKDAAENQIQRFPRIKMTAMHRIAFREGASGEFKLANLSVGGMALIGDEGSALGWKKESLISGTFVVDKSEHKIEARVRHITQSFAGCEFIGENKELRQSIESYLRVEILALNLSMVNPQYIKEDPRGKASWYTDGKQNELYATEDAKGVSGFHLSFFGTYLEYDRTSGLRTGLLHDEEADDTNPGYKGSSIIEMKGGIPIETISLADTFVRNIEKMPAETRGKIAAILRQSRKS
jgi:hypothetical protein